MPTTDSSTRATTTAPGLPDLPDLPGVSADPAAAAPASGDPASGDPASRWELLRALGAALVSPPPSNEQVTCALGLPTPTGAEHTDAFVLTAPPHAAIHLGPEGGLGGEGLDRVSGFWRALGLEAPQDADHLGVLLMLYAELGQAGATAGSDRSRAQLDRARVALLHEHLWSWAPGYLTAVTTVAIPSVTPWAQLTLEALRQEKALSPPASLLPLALRAAPPQLAASETFDGLLDAMVAPIRSGLILTRYDLRRAATTLGVGYRQGERRYALEAMLQQDKPATLKWLADQARLWAGRHGQTVDSGTDDSSSWWATRAAATAAVLDVLAERAAGGSKAP